MPRLLDFAQLRRPSSPNTYLVAPPDLCERADPDDSVTLQRPTSDVFEDVCALVEGRNDWRVSGRDDTSRALRFVATTGLMRFRDDVDIRVIETQSGEASLAIYSRSRIGYSDLGANRKRVQEIIACLKTMHVKS